MGGDTYVVARTSADALNWNAPTTIGYERSQPASGSQGFHAGRPALIAGSMVAVYAADLEQSSGYGVSDCMHVDAGWQPFLLDLLIALATPVVAPYASDPRAVSAPTCPCQQVGFPIDALTGYESTSATDLSIPALGLPLVVRRNYSSADGLAALDGPFGAGWHWDYSVYAIPLKDGSLTIVDADGRRMGFGRMATAGRLPARSTQRLHPAGAAVTC